MKMAVKTLAIALLAIATAESAASQPYSDGRPAAALRMDAKDHGVVLRYGDGPNRCDVLGARDVWVFEDGGTYYMHYDAAGPKGWLCSLAVSEDLLSWEKKGPILDFGKPGEDDSAGACYGVTYGDADQWHMFYLGTPNTSPAPDLVPSFPYLTMKARASSSAGPWIKQKDVLPFRTKPNTYYSLTASPGQIIKRGDKYLQFFSATTRKDGNPCVQRTLGIARTKNLDGPWTVDPQPMVPIEEQIENASLYYEKTNQTWFLFTNHIGIDKGEYTDAIWVYWSKELDKWDPANKAIVLDGQNCSWSNKCIGLPSVVQTGKRLALFYDAPGGNSTSHMKRSIGLAWLDLPLKVPETQVSAAQAAPLRIMPLGDSITAGYTDNPNWNVPFEFGYRGRLYELLRNAGHRFEFVGASSEPWDGRWGRPDNTPSPDLRALGQDQHRGYGGWGINAIQENIVGWNEADRPDIILLQIGINGINQSSPRQLDALVDTILAESPGVHLIVAQITPLGVFDQNLYDYNMHIRDTLVPAKAAEGFRISTVDHYSLFLTDPDDPTSIGAGLHSNPPHNNHPTGPLYDKMAENWFEVLDAEVKARACKSGLVGGISVTDLRCEYLTDPLGIDVHPRLSWRLESGERGQRQTAYHLLVASSPKKLAQDAGDLWDSGTVESDQTVHVAYDGTALESRTQCFWKVRVWDKNGHPSAWSEPAMWSMGLLHPEDWKAQWIGVTAPLKAKDVVVTKARYQTLDASVAVDVTAIVKQELAKGKPLTVDFKTLGGDPARGVAKELVVEYSHQGKPGVTRARDFETLKWSEAPTSPFYRQSFHIDVPPERATLYVAPLGYFELYVNGQKVGDEFLAPAVSNFSKRSYYRTYDVTGFLEQGVNSLGIWMGTGWYSPGLPGVKNDSPVVRAQLELFRNGRKQLVTTDTSWQTKPSERKLLGQWRWGKFGGEQVDARKLDAAWWDTERTTQDWAAVVEVDVAEVPCTAQLCAGNIGLDVISPRSVERLDEDTILVDFGTNLTGMLHMTFRNLKAGQRISLHYGDLDGRQEEDAWRARQTRKGFAVYGQFDEFISAGGAEETFKNIFNYHAFRYVLVEGLPYVPEKSDMTAVPVETQVAETGQFTCSNELYNRIHQMVRWTYRCLNLGGQTVDCPHRERLGYGDGQTIMDTGLFNFDAAALYVKWSRNWWDEQKADGYVPFTAPCPHGTGGGPAWGAMCIMVPWKTYLFSNDRRLLQEGYPYMTNYMDYLSAHCEDGVLQDIFPGEKWPNLGDWVPPRRGMDTTNWPDATSRQFFNNCYRVHLLQIMQTIAGLLGRDGDKKAFEQEMTVAQKKIHQAWFDPNDESYANGEQPYLIFPLKTGVTPEPLSNAVFGKYVETLLGQNKGHLNTGMIGTQIMTDYLLEINRNDLVDTFVNKTTYPGWGYMVEQGATTCWEQWNGYYSQIHSCFPTIGGWFYRGLAGIRWDPEVPGFKHVILRPAVVKSVDWVMCSYDSPHGRIVSNWKLENGTFVWDISVPANSTATVHVPANDVRSVKEGGNTLQEATGVTFLRMAAGSAVLRVESGTYEFVSEYDRGKNR